MRQTKTDVAFDSDAMLLEDARRGRGEALSLLVARHRDAVHVIVRNLLAAVAGIAAVTQDTFATAFCGFRAKPEERPFKIWLYGIAVQKALLKRRLDRADAHPEDQSRSTCSKAGT